MTGADVVIDVLRLNWVMLFGRADDDDESLVMVKRTVLLARRNLGRGMRRRRPPHVGRESHLAN